MKKSRLGEKTKLKLIAKGKGRLPRLSAFDVSAFVWPATTF